MRIKTIVIILITVLLTITLTQNTEPVKIKFLFLVFYPPAIAIMLTVCVVGFILGYLVGRPKRPIKLGGDATDSSPNKNEPGTLSDEDREYIE